MEVNTTTDTWPKRYWCVTEGAKVELVDLDQRGGIQSKRRPLCFFCKHPAVAGHAVDNPVRVQVDPDHHVVEGYEVIRVAHDRCLRAAPPEAQNPYGPDIFKGRKVA